MKPATSLDRWRETAGTRRCTSSKPTSAIRHTAPTVRTPLTMVCSKVKFSPLVNPTVRHSSRNVRPHANLGARTLSSAVGEEPVAGENEERDEHYGPEYRGE